MDPAANTSIRSSDVAFPRGGASVLSPLETKRIANKATEDVLFEQQAAKRPRSEDTRQKGKKKARKAEKKEPADENEKKIAVEHFTFANMTPGASVLAQITHVGPTHLTVAIGDNLYANVPITAVSEEVTAMLEAYEAESSDDEDETVGAAPFRPEAPQLTSLFAVGQWLRAVVTSAESRKSIVLSIEPSLVNAATEQADLVPGNVLQVSVKSHEDHGVIFSAGVGDFSGFMSNKELKKAEIDPESLKTGSVVLAAVASSSGRTVNLRPPQSEPVTKKTVLGDVSSVDAVHPGAIVNALIVENTAKGVVARIFGLADATFTLPHVENYSLDKLENHFALGATVRARVIGVVVVEGSRKFMLSRAQPIFNLEPKVSTEALDAFPAGYVFDEPVTVAGIDESFIYVSTGTSIYGQIHKSNCDPEKNPNTDYPVGSSHRARVMGYNQIDNVLTMTFKPAVIDAKFALASAIPIGEYISSAEILRILPDNKGLVIKCFGFHEVLVPFKHMSDVSLVYPERKFKVGGKVKGRILNKKGNKLLATLRKSLVNMDEESVLSSFDNVSEGFRTTAVVEKFVAGGVVVSFFGNLRAFLPKNEISETVVEDPRLFLKENQAVSVRVLRYNPETGKIAVTLRQAAELTDKQVEHLESIVSGRTIVKASVAEKTKEAIVVQLEESNVRGVIYTGHLSDGNYEENRIIYKGLKVGGILEALVLEKDNRARTVTLSAKKSLLTAAKLESLPLHYADIHTGATVSGFIKSVTNLGLFVSFAGKLTGLVLPKDATTERNEDLSKLFYKHQSVTCDVVKTDDENKRFLLSLINSDHGEAFKSKKLKNPVDSSKTTVTDYAPGELTTGAIESVEGSSLHIRLADNFFGRVHASQCFASWDDFEDKVAPLSKFKVGKTLKVKVIGFHNSKSNKFSQTPFAAEHNVAELSILDEQVKSSAPYKPLTLDESAFGSEYTAFIDSVANGIARVTIAPGVSATVPVYNLTEDADKFQEFDQHFCPGAAVQLKYVKVDPKTNKNVFSAKTAEIKSAKNLKVGHRYPGTVSKITECYVIVDVAKNAVVRSFITEALNDYDQKLDEVFTLGQPVVATVTEVTKKEGKAEASLRNEAEAKDKFISSFDQLERGMLIKGFVKSISNNGLFVALSKDLYALVRVTDISDAYLSDWKKYFKLYQSVTGKITVCKTEGRILMTLKDSEVNGDLKNFKQFDELEVDQIFDGTVTRVTDFGVFVKLDDTSNISGLCHRSQISDNQIENIGDFFGEGDRVKVKILKINEEKKQLSLGMKASYFTELSDEDEKEDVEMKDESEDESEDEVMEDAFEDAESESEDEAEGTTKNESAGLSGLSTNGFDWTASILDQAEDESSDDEDDDFTKTKKKRKGKKQVQDRTGEINSRTPQSVGDFERLIVGNPDSSVLWMNYMSFQLQLGEIDKSREIAERALKTINFREEQEKMNIWIAILNLENSFGTDESLNEAFKRSVQYMDSLTMYQKLVGIYQLSEKFDKATELLSAMCKKFSQNPTVWVQFGSFYMDQQLMDEAHQVLARALQSLPKRDHIEVVRKFGQLEFTKGDAEQGRSLFEGLISDAPKRIDLWNVYIDQEIKAGDREKVEALFERVITKKLSKKQAKFFFSKWLSFVEDAGDEKAAARVKALAVEFVQQQQTGDEA